MKLDRILKGFHKTINQLEKLEGLNRNKIDENQVQIDVLVSTNTELDKEAVKAQRVAEKLRDLLGDD